MQLRYATAAAAGGWAEVVRSACPYLVYSEKAVVHDMEHRPTLGRFVVVEDGEVLGVMGVRRGAAEELSVAVSVRLDHRGRGAGRLLFDRALRLVDQVARHATLTGIVNGDEDSMAVARHWGFVLEREHSLSSVDPRDVAAPGPAPGGLHVVPLTEAGPKAVWECHESAAPSDPSGLTRSIPFEEYDVTQWRNPDHRPDLGRAVLDSGTVLSYTSVLVAGDRAWTSMTGTRPESRGRGLATLAKQHSLNALAAAGVDNAWTGNDAANAPMLAVNERLGYRRSASTWGAVRRP